MSTETTALAASINANSKSKVRSADTPGQRVSPRYACPTCMPLAAIQHQMICLTAPGCALYVTPASQPLTRPALLRLQVCSLPVLAATSSAVNVRKLHARHQARPKDQRSHGTVSLRQHASGLIPRSMCRTGTRAVSMSCRLQPPW